MDSIRKRVKKYATKEIALAVCLVFTLIMPFNNLCCYSAEDKNVENVVEKGKKIKFDYKLFSNGYLFSSSDSSGAIEYVHGEGKIGRALEKKIEGMKVGENRKIILPPEDAFGPVDPNAFLEIAKKDLPENIKYTEGQIIRIPDKTGKLYPAMIVKNRERSVILNFNHPLAGQKVEYDITILEIK